MDYAEQVIQQVLKEEVQQNNVIHAIKRRHEVSFMYNNGDGDNKGKRERITVQPVVYGLTKKNNPCFRAYQVNGSSESYEKGEGAVPGWRLFLLSNVVDNSWKESGRVFKRPPMYNENGDKTMLQVLVQADFEGSTTRYERGGLKNFNDKRREDNINNNPFYDIEKQSKKKQMAPQWVMKNIEDTSKTPKQREGEWNMASAEKINQNAIRDMARQKDFGDNNIQQTIGPQRKGKIDDTTPKTKPQIKGYEKMLKNGPVLKDKESVENNNDKQNNWYCFCYG